MADYLLGYVSDLQLSNVFVTNQRHQAQMFFVQDDWKVNSRLSLNLGLRYDYMTPALEANNSMTNFNPAGTGSLIFATDGSLLQRSLVNPDRNNFAPRAGVVYKLDDKTILRGGYGHLLQPVRPRRQRGSAVAESAGAGQQDDHADVGLAGVLPAAGIPGRLPERAEPRSGGRAAQGGPPALGRSERSQHHDPAGERRPAARAAGAAWCCRPTSSTPARSNLATLVNLNQPLPNAAGNNALGALPYPNFGFIEWRSDNGRADYKGVDLGLEKRFARGYAFGFAYTIGKSQDNASEQLTTQGSNAFPQNARDFEPWYGPSDYDVRHRFSANFVWDAAARRQRVRARLDGLRASTPRTPAIRSRSPRAATTSAPA